MTRFYRIFLFLLTLSTPLWISGCGACPRALAVYATASSLTSEAEQRLSQVENLLSIASNIPSDTKAQIVLALSKAHDGLVKSELAMRTFKEACESGAIPPGIFQDFNAAWAVIRQFIPVIAALVGTTNGGQVSISDPTVFRIQ